MVKTEAWGNGDEKKASYIAASISAFGDLSVDNNGKPIKKSPFSKNTKNTESVKGQSQNIYEIRKNIFKIGKRI